MLKRCALAAIGLVAFVDIAVAKPTVIRCRGYQISDHHSLTDQIIVFDAETKIAISVQLVGANSKQIINVPMIVSKNELRWSYDSLGFKYVLNRNTLSLQLLSDSNYELGIFECKMS
jgi:hypothetical protein